MTDKEIIKALECCKDSYSSRKCLGCPYYCYNAKKDCVDEMKCDALDLINRQQAEIENLQADKEALINGQLTLQKDITKKQLQINNLEKIKHRKDETISEQLNLLMELDRKLDTVKSEAIKEFAERLKETIEDYQYVIDNLVKEMVGDAE